MTIREYFQNELNSIRQDHKLLQMIHWESGVFFIPRIATNEVKNEHIQIGKECVYDHMSEFIFGGCEPTFYDEYAYNWWHNLSLDCYELYEYKKYSKESTFEWHLKKEFKIPRLIFEV